MQANIFHLLLLTAWSALHQDFPNWALGGGGVSWVQAWRWSLSPPEGATSCLPGLNCSNTTHLPSITLPAVPNHHGLLYTPHSCCSVWLYCMCMFVLVTAFSRAGYTCTVCRFPCSSRLSCFVFWPCWPFGLLKDAYLHLDPNPCPYTGDISHRTVTMWPLTDFKGQRTCKSSLILKYNAVLCECLNWKTFWMYCIEAVGYFRKENVKG